MGILIFFLKQIEIFVNMGSYGSENFKTLLLLQFCWFFWPIKNKPQTFLMWHCSQKLLFGILKFSNLNIVPNGKWKNANILEMANCRVIIGWNLGLLGSFNMYMGHLWPFSVYKVILKSLSALILRWPVTRKMLFVEQNGVKFSLLGVSRPYSGYLWPRSVKGHLGVLPCTCLKMVCM